MTTGEKGGPVQTEQAKHLYDRWLLDIPKVLDIAALYGPDNPELTRQFLTKVKVLESHYTSLLTVSICDVLCVGVNR